MKKIREKIRKFRVSEKGFTLIELIVVIAIIGILAAIGTVAYSGYIESANQAADEQLAYDVSYAIQLGAMDEGITGINTEDEDAEDNGYVELTSTGMNLYLYTSDGYTKIELTGSSTGAAGYYAQTLAVDYDALESDAWGELVDGWLTDGVGSSWDEQVLKSDKYTKDEDSDSLKVYIPSGDIYYPGNSDSEEKTLSETIAANLTNYASSSYAGNEEDLMESVESISDTFGGLVSTYATKLGLTSAEFLAYLTGYMDSWGNWVDEDGWNEILATYGYTNDTLTDEAAGNLMVMLMASMLTDDYAEEDGTISSSAVETLVDTIASKSSYSIESYFDDDSYADLTAWFGVATAYALSGYASDDYVSTYNSTVSSLASSTANAAATSLKNLCASMAAEIDTSSEYYTSDQMTKDATAFMSLMSVLTESYSSGDYSVDLSTMSWDDDTLSYLTELLETYSIDVSSSE